MYVSVCLNFKWVVVCFVCLCVSCVVCEWVLSCVCDSVYFCVCEFECECLCIVFICAYVCEIVNGIVSVFERLFMCVFESV